MQPTAQASSCQVLSSLLAGLLPRFSVTFPQQLQVSTWAWPSLHVQDLPSGRYWIRSELLWLPARPWSGWPIRFSRIRKYAALSLQSPTVLDMEPPITGHINISQSPFLHEFYSYHPLHLTINTGTETNMMRASLTRHIGAKVTKSSQTTGFAGWWSYPVSCCWWNSPSSDLSWHTTCSGSSHCWGSWCWLTGRNALHDFQQHHSQPH